MSREAATLAALVAAAFVGACTGELLGHEGPDLDEVDGGLAAADARLADAAIPRADAAEPTADAEPTPLPPDATQAVTCGDTFCDATENGWECSEDCGMPSVPADFAGVIWLHTNVSGWAQTANLASVNINGSQICLSHDKADVWPGVDHVGAFVNGNPWIFIYHEGELYAATWEWMRFGQTCKNASSVAGDHIKQNPFWDFQPESGTWYGFMVSGLARDSVRNAEERSNVVMLRWP